MRRCCTQLKACLTPSALEIQKSAYATPRISSSSFNQSALLALAQEYSQQDNRQDHRQNEQQHASRAPRILLIPRRTPQLHIGTPRIRPRIIYIRRNRIELVALLAHDMCHVAEELVQLAHALLDIADLRLPLHDQRVLEVHLVLRGEPQLLLRLLLLPEYAATAPVAALAWRAGFFERGARGAVAGAFFGEGGLLDVLEFAEGGLEFARELLLRVSL